MLNIACQDALQSSGREEREQVGRGAAGKKSSTATKIMLKEAAKPHHNLGERVAQVRGAERDQRRSTLLRLL